MVRGGGPSTDGRSIKRVDDDLFLNWIDPPVPWFQPESFAVFLTFGAEALKTWMSSCSRTVSGYREEAAASRWVGVQSQPLLGRSRP
jgi:hypothetical protein